MPLPAVCNVRLFLFTDSRLGSRLRNLFDLSTGDHSANRDVIFRQLDGIAFFQRVLLAGRTILDAENT